MNDPLNIGPVSFDAGPVRAAFSSSARDFTSVVSQISERGVDWNTQLPSGWTLRTVVGHTSRALRTPGRYLETGAGRDIDTVHPFDYFRGMTSDYSKVEAIVRRAEQSGADLGNDLAASVSDLASSAIASVGAAADDAPVATPSGVMSLLSYLPSRIFVLTTDTADLASTFGLDHEACEACANLALMMSVGIAVEAADAVDALTVLVSSTPRVLLPVEPRSEPASRGGFSRLRRKQPDSAAPSS